MGAVEPWRSVTTGGADVGGLGLDGIFARRRAQFAWGVRPCARRV